MEQFAVLSVVTQILGRTLEESVSEALGRKVRVLYEYEPDAREGNGALTVCFVNVRRRPGDSDREHELTEQGEQFRNPPILLRSTYLVSAWAKPPADQALLGAALRTFLDKPYLELRGMEEERVIGYAGVPSVDMGTLALDEHRQMADGFGMPLAPSVAYFVDIRIQSGKSTPIKRVRERVIDYRKIEG